MALTDAASIKAWASPDMDSTRDTELTRVASAASAWIERFTRRTIEQWSATKTRYFNGYDAGGPGRDLILLPQGDRPVIHSGGDLLTVTEDGTSLTVATGYSDTADVILVGANEDKRARLIRRANRWAAGHQNIAVTYLAGYSASDLSDRPEIKQLATEVAWAMFKTPEAFMKSSRSAGGSTVTFDRDLTPQSQETLRELFLRV